MEGTGRSPEGGEVRAVTEMGVVESVGLGPVAGELLDTPEAEVAETLAPEPLLADTDTAPQLTAKALDASPAAPRAEPVRREANGTITQITMSGGPPPVPVRTRKRAGRMRSHQLGFSVFWVAVQGGNPAKIGDIRKVTRREISTAAIRQAIKIHYGNRLSKPAQRAGRLAAEAIMPPKYPYYFRLPKKERRGLAFRDNGRLVRDYRPQLTPANNQPPTWSDVRDRYTASLSYRIRHSVQAAQGQPGSENDPRYLWGRYWVGDLVGRVGPQIGQEIVRLARIPRVDPERVRELETEFRPDRPFLCFVGDTAVRVGIKDGEPLILRPREIALLNLLMICELRSDRPVGTERLERLIGLERPKLNWHLGQLMDKINLAHNMAGAHRVTATIIRTARGGNPHYRIQSSALVLDARPRRK